MKNSSAISYTTAFSLLLLTACGPKEAPPVPPAPMPPPATSSAPTGTSEAPGLDPKAAQAFARLCGDLFTKAEAAQSASVEGKDGWLFSANELRFLSVGPFWGEAAARVSRASKPELGDPIPAIVDFHAKLKAKGIQLVLLPVPPKAVVSPDKLPGDLQADAGRLDGPLQTFYHALSEKGVNVLDPTSDFMALNSREPMHCKTDAHWSPAAVNFIADQLVRQIETQAWYKKPAAIPFKTRNSTLEITGDLVSEDGATKETINVLQVGVGDALDSITENPDSPVLLLGDSHTLVFGDNSLLCDRASLFDLLSFKLGEAIDRIGMKGSASTAVRTTLYRKSKATPGWLDKKKLVIWCFTAREFTESSSGWRVLPIEPQ